MSTTNKRTRNRKNGKKGNRRFRRRDNVPQSIVFPRQKRVMMRYTTMLSIDSTGPTITNQVFSANNINDPEVAIGGNRPIPYDQWKTWYNHYCVVGSKMTVKLFPSTNTTNVPNAVGVYLDDSNTIPTTYDIIVMNAKGQYKVMPTAQSAGGQYTLTATYSAKRFFNITDIKDNFEQLGAPFDNNPKDQAYFHVWCQPVDKLTNTGGYSGVVTIDYIVDLFEPKDLPASL